MDAETLKDIGRVHIYDTRGRITISDVDGFFRIKVVPDDTLTFSRIDYETKKLAITGWEPVDLVVTLKQKVYVLDTVDFMAEYTVPAYLLRPEKKPMNIDGITKKVDPGEDYHLGVGGSLVSPATAIYQLFSKQYKEQKKVYELKKQEAKEDALRKKAYARIDEILEINEITLFRDEYDRLIEHCRLNLYWVIDSNNYELYLRMKDCLKDFK